MSQKKWLAGHLYDLKLVPTGDAGPSLRFIKYDRNLSLFKGEPGQIEGTTESGELEDKVSRKYTQIAEKAEQD